MQNNKFYVNDDITDSLVRKAINICESSDYLISNTRYRDIVKAIHYTYVSEPVLNSFAVRRDGINYIYTFNGLCTMLCLYAAVFGTYMKSHNVKQAKDAISWISDNMIGECTYSEIKFSAIKMEEISSFSKKFPVYYNKALYSMYRELSVKAIAAVLGHETGHVCLGHVDGTSMIENNVSRNDERSADLFACSILQGTGIGGSFADGVLLMTLSLYFLSGDDDGDGNHPSSVERVMNIIQSFKNELEYSNIHESDILKLLD